MLVMKSEKKKHIQPKIVWNKILALRLILFIFGSLLILALAAKLFFKSNSTKYFPTKSVDQYFKIPTPPAEIIDRIHKMKTETPGPKGPYRIPILMYHYVEYVQDRKDTIRISLDILPNIFEEQIITLLDDGYTFLTLRDLGEILDGKGTLPPKPIILTFDDGYRDFYTDVFPILKKHHVKATAYVVPGFLNMPNYMFIDQLQEIAASDLMEIAAHTVHHVWLKGAPPARTETEIMQSKVMLEKFTNKPVVSFAYPFGAFDSQTEALVKKSGFTTAVATIPGITQGEENRYYLFRLRPGGRTGKALLTWLGQSHFNAY